MEKAKVMLPHLASYQSDSAAGYRELPRSYFRAADVYRVRHLALRCTVCFFQDDGG